MVEWSSVVLMAVLCSSCVLFAFFPTSTPLFGVDAGAVLGKRRAEKDNPQARSFAVVNQSGRKCDFYWVNVFVKPETFVPQFVEDGVTIGLAYGADKSVSSFIGHEFELRELPSKKTETCIYDTCRSVRVKVSDRYDQKVTLDRDFKITVEDDKAISYNKADAMFTRCQTQITRDEEAKKEMVYDPNNYVAVSPLAHIDAVTACMEQEMDHKLRTAEEERTFQSTIHRDMAADLVPFTCGNVNETQSKEIQNLTWYDTSNNENRPRKHKQHKRKYTIRKLHELPTSTILVVDQFVTTQQCDVLKDTSRHYHQEQEQGGTPTTTTPATEQGDTIIPLSVAYAETEQGRLFKALLNSMYNLVMETLDWDELDVDGDVLFTRLKDDIGVVTPLQLCQGPEEVADAVAALEGGGEEPPRCNIPGGEPIIVPTRRRFIEDDKKEKESRRRSDGATATKQEQKSEQQPLAELFVFCDEPDKKMLGAMNFPYARIHITPEPGKLVIAVNRKNHEEDEDHDDDAAAAVADRDVDGYVNEYHLCPNHDVYVHTISKVRPGQPPQQQQHHDAGGGGGAAAVSGNGVEL